MLVIYLIISLSWWLICFNYTLFSFPVITSLSLSLSLSLLHSSCRLMSLNLALRFILDALKKQPSSKMYLFGLAALDKCKKRLKEFPQFCSGVANIPHFQSFPMHLKHVSII